MEHENRALPPIDDDLRAFCDLADIDIDRAAGGDGRCIRVHLVDQRDERCQGANCGHRAGRDVEEIAAGRALPGVRCRLRSMHCSPWSRPCIEKSFGTRPSTVALARNRRARAFMVERPGFRQSSNYRHPNYDDSAILARFSVSAGVPEASISVQSSGRGRNFPAPGRPTGRRRRRPWRGHRPGRFGSQGSR